MAEAKEPSPPPPPPLRAFFFPLPSPGHMIPLLDIAKLFARRGAAVTIITTPGNVPLVRPTTAVDDRRPANGPPIELLVVHFPEAFAHLVPAAGENLGAISISEFPGFMAAVLALQEPVEALLRLHRPDCLISDSMYPWTSSVALELGIPRLVFYGYGAFVQCAHRCLEFRSPHNAVASDDEVFVVEGLAHRIEMTRKEVSNIFTNPQFINLQRLAEESSFGVLVNTFYDLEPEYAELLTREPKTKAWYVGPVALSCRQDESGTKRGGQAHPEIAKWQDWLGAKPPGSVVYVCFGSIYELSENQIKELALGLVACGHPFVWVLRGGAAGPPAEWMPEGYDDMIKGRGLVVRGWAPQVVLLEHAAVGGFLTHCGWNSALEAVTAGKPMATLPLSYDQFLNEKLMTELVGVGVRVRRREASGPTEVSSSEVASAVRKLMDGGEEAEGMRRRARELASKARAAMEEGGSSHEDMNRLFGELINAIGTSRADTKEEDAAVA